MIDEIPAAPDFRQHSPSQIAIRVVRVGDVAGGFIGGFDHIRLRVDGARVARVRRAIRRRDGF